MRRFLLNRLTDVSGISGTGVVADGVEMDDGTAVVRWAGDWPTTVVHERGMESVQHIHGHAGATKIEWLDDENGNPLRRVGDTYHEQKMAMPDVPQKGFDSPIFPDGGPAR